MNDHHQVPPLPQCDDVIMLTRLLLSNTGTASLMYNGMYSKVCRNERERGSKDGTDDIQLPYIAATTFEFGTFCLSVRSVSEYVVLCL